MLRLRVMDTWSHEQDMRRALGRAGNVEGSAAEEAVGFFAGSVIEVVDGRANVAEREPGEVSVAQTIPPTTFAALVGAGPTYRTMW